MKYSPPFACVYRSSRELWTILLGRSALREPVSSCPGEQVWPSLIGLQGQIRHLYISLNISENSFCWSSFFLSMIFVPKSLLLVCSSTACLQLLHELSGRVYGKGGSFSGVGTSVVAWGALGCSCVVQLLSYFEGWSLCFQEFAQRLGIQMFPNLVHCLPFSHPP